MENNNSLAEELVLDHLEGFRGQVYRNDFDNGERSMEVATDSAKLTIRKMEQVLEWAASKGWRLSPEGYWYSIIKSEKPTTQGYKIMCQLIVEVHQADCCWRLHSA